MMSAHPKTTIWVWPTGLFPRRLVYYFRAKHVTTSTLQAHNIHLIPITIANNAFASLPGFEAKPTDTSLPVMRVEAETGTYLVRESIAILEYLEDLFTPSTGHPDLRGSTPDQRARTRDILSLLADATVWSGVSLVHSNPHTTSWSGLKEDQMSDAAAVHARGKFRGLMRKLEGWVGEEKASSLSGEGGKVTLADVCLMTQVEYMREMYGVDWLEGSEVLKVWYERAKGEEWCVGRDGLESVEKTGEWSVVFG